ncbi:MAG: hypothetical protein GXP48_00375 [Acidobacteria bacterium]|nr:hypothetical protein [Acidobacteriota bacterium]
MPFLIDGNNLMHALPAGRRSRDAVRQMMLDLARRERISITLVFDGPPATGVPERENLGRVTVIYSGASSADDVLIRLLPQRPAVQSWTLVTDDRELTARARNAGARTRRLSEWRHKLTGVIRPGGKPEKTLSEAEIHEWEDYFRKGGGS